MIFFKNRKSVAILFIIGFWIVYSVTTIGIFVKDQQELFFIDQGNQEKKIQYQANIALSFLIQDQVEALKALLTEGMSLNQFDFAILLDPRSTPFTIVRSGTIELNDSYAPTNGVRQFGDYLYQTVKIDGKTFTVGSHHNGSTFLLSQFGFYAWKILFDIAIITALAGALIMFVLRDVIKLSNLLKGSAKRNLTSIQPRSSEAQVFLSATESFEKLSQDLARESQMFSSSLGSAITTELRRGTAAPTSFPAVLVRVDLNSYTQKYLSTDLHQMTTALNQYFAAAREIIERHQGLIYEYIGDEIVFFFKDTTPHDITLFRAACCVRDLFAEVSSLNLPEFTLKASLSSGTLNFVKLDQGPAFSGVPLIQSARMLNYISNKKVSSLIVLNSDLPALGPMVEQQITLSGELKGFEGQFDLTEINAFQSMLKPNPANYRSSADLSSSLSALVTAFEDHDLNTAQSLLSELREVQVQSRAHGIAKEYLSGLQVIVSDPFDLKVLSLMVSLSKNFLPLGEYNQTVKSLLLKVEKMSDARTRANALLARAHFETDLNLELEKIDKSSSRLLADSLFVLGRKAVDPRLLKEIETLVAHKDPGFRASGLYLTSALLEFHRQNDAIYFKTNPCFERMRKILKESLGLTDPNLQKHALAYEEMSGAKL